MQKTCLLSNDFSGHLYKNDNVKSTEREPFFPNKSKLELYKAKLGIHKASKSSDVGKKKKA